MTERHKAIRALVVPALALLLLFAPQAARAVRREAGDVKKVERRADGVVLTLTSGARVAITFITHDVVRVRFAPSGTFERDVSYAVAPKDRDTVAVWTDETRDEIKIQSLMLAPGSTPPVIDKTSASLSKLNDVIVDAQATVVVRRRPFLVAVLDDAGRTVVEDDPASQTSFDTETGAVECSKKRVGWEVYYGLGEKAGATISHDTQQFVMWNTDTYAYPRGLDPIYESIGFYIALRNERDAKTAQEKGAAYGLFLDNTSRTFFDMGKTNPSRVTFGAASGELNYYVFTGGRERTPKNVLRDYTDLTGRAPMPPVWALGNQQSRWSYSPESRVREVAKGFRDARIPADVIYLDIDYMDGYRVFTWDKTRFPDPAKMIADLKALGFRVVVIVDPGVKVDPNYYAYIQGQTGNHFVKNADGSELHATVWPGVCAFPDFTDPSAREWFGSLYKTNVELGIAGFWNDMNEPGVFLSDTTPKPDIYHHPMKTFPPDARHTGDGSPGTHARYHNVFGMQMARSTFEGVKRLRPDARPFVLTRAGYAGVQRYSAIWTGDNVASWDHLRLSIPMLLNLGVSGVPLVGTDVGGFSGNPTPELYTRWLQAAALTPFLRSHSEWGSNPHEPYSFPKEFTDINRASIELRYRLLPYLYTLFREHTETGAPVMRPLWFEYPDDQRTYLIEDQYLVGRDLLVAPVVVESTTKRKVYFPKGDNWVDWWTGKLYEGGKEVEVEAPLDRLPLFARSGAVIPTQPVIQHTGEMSRVPLTLMVAFSPPVTDLSVSPDIPIHVHKSDVSRLYEDAGEGFGYQRGSFRMTTITQTDNRIRLSGEGIYDAARPLAAVEYLGLNAAPHEVRVGGRVVTNATFDAATHRLTVPLPAANVEDISITP
jgi:alpha-glucosidase